MRWLVVALVACGGASHPVQPPPDRTGSAEPPPTQEQTRPSDDALDEDPPEVLADDVIPLIRTGSLVVPGPASGKKLLARVQMCFDDRGASFRQWIRVGSGDPAWDNLVVKQAAEITIRPYEQDGHAIAFCTELKFAP